MKRLILAMAILLCITSYGMAAPLLVPGTLADYIALGPGGGQIGDLRFFDFAYAGSGFGGAAAIPASGIAVTPLADPLNPGLLFSAAWSVGPGQGLDSLIQFKIEALGKPIADISAAMAGYSHAGGGLVTVAETTTIGNLLLFDSAAGTTAFAEITFDPTTGIIEVVKDIAVNGHSDGVAAVSAVSNNFSQVPLPAALFLLGPGLAGLAIMRRRVKN